MTSDFIEKFSISSKKKTFFLSLFIIVLISGIGFGLYLLSQTQIFKPRAAWRVIEPGYQVNCSNCSAYGWNDGTGGYTRVPASCFIRHYKCPARNASEALRRGCQSDLADAVGTYSRSRTGVQSNGFLNYPTFDPNYCGVQQIDVGNCAASWHSVVDLRARNCAPPPPPPPPPPAQQTGSCPASAPVNLGPSGNVSPGTYLLTWTDMPGRALYLFRAEDQNDGNGNGHASICDTQLRGGPGHDNRGDECYDAVGDANWTLNVENGHTYTWWVHCIDGAGRVGPPTQTSITGFVPPPPPPPPLAIAPPPPPPPPPAPTATGTPIPTATSTPTPNVIPSVTPTRTPTPTPTTTSNASATNTPTPTEIILAQTQTTSTPTTAAQSTSSPTQAPTIPSAGSSAGILFMVLSGLLLVSLMLVF